MNSLSPYHGLSAQRIAGVLMIENTPSTAITVNHTHITGPNNLPIWALPRF